MAASESGRDPAADDAARPQDTSAGSAGEPPPAARSAGAPPPTAAEPPPAAGSPADSADAQADAVADVLAEDLLRHGGPARQGLADVLHQLGAIDRSVYAAVASVPAPALDHAMRRLSKAADRSRLWLGIAAALALTGPAGQRSATRGVLAIGVTS